MLGKNTMTKKKKAVWEERVYLSLREVKIGTQGTNLEAGTEAEAVEEHFQPAFLYNTRPSAQGWYLL